MLHTDYFLINRTFDIYSHPQRDLISVARKYLPVAGIKTRLTQTPSQSF